MSQRQYVDKVVLKVVFSLKWITWSKLLHTSRSIIYLLTTYIDFLRGPPTEESYLSSPTLAVYISIADCNGGPHTNLSAVTDFVLFWEIIHTWAVTKNITVVMNTAYEAQQTEETVQHCPEEYRWTGREPCLCGWWHVSNKYETLSNGNLVKRIIIDDKKSIARRLYAQQHSPKKHQTTNSSPSEKTNDLSLILIPSFTLLFFVMLGVFTVYVVYVYRSKNIITQTEVHKLLFTSRDVSLPTTENELNGSAQGRCYDKERFEITPSSFSIDYTRSLGEGEFATVFKGTIQKAEQITEVAVKMLSNRISKRGQSHGRILAIKGLVSEIKILSYVGDHQNIVKLEGAFTTKLTKGEILVFLELCSLGNLENYLRALVPEHTDAGFSNDTMVDETSFSKLDPTINSGSINDNHDAEEYHLPVELGNDILKWSQEILCGMEYLTSKNLVHANLATRNGLLDASKTAKISDFGLSRRLYDYSEYIKHEATSLPWRWMAPESLCKQFFTEKTDVWAFGATLWEIYTLGDLPYPGLSWDINFPALLRGGVRLTQPKFASKRLYKIMQKCWATCPNDRPTFSELQTILRTD